MVTDENVLEVAAGLELLGQGRTRKVYALTDHLVLKVGVPRVNLLEVNRWGQHRGAILEAKLAAIVDSSPAGCWLVMERAAATVGQHFWRPHYADEYEGDEMFRHLRAFAVDLPDDLRRHVATANVGIMLDGRTALLDYGDFG